MTQLFAYALNLFFIQADIIPILMLQLQTHLSRRCEQVASHVTLSRAALWWRVRAVNHPISKTHAVRQLSPDLLYVNDYLREIPGQLIYIHLSERFMDGNEDPVILQ